MPRQGEAPPEIAAELPAEPKAAEPNKEVAPLDPEAQTQEQIREALTLENRPPAIPVALQVKLPAGRGRQMPAFPVRAPRCHSSLHFHKDGDHNLNTLTFVFAVFDEKESLVNAQQRRARLNVLDAQLPSILKSGVDVNATFQLKPGIYRIREVVTDSEDHHMTTFSREVQIP